MSVPRTLALFWGPVLLVLGVGAGVLEVLGPPSVPVAASVASQTRPAVIAVPTAPPSVAPAPAPPAPAIPVPAPATPAPAPAASPTAATAPTSLPTLLPLGAPVAAPDPALLEPAKDYQGAMLPKIGSDGRMSMHVYAAGFDPTDKRPRIALLIADFGMSEADSEAVVRDTPAAVSLAVSPYAVQPDKLLQAARAAGHEMLISIPMEPQNYPLNDAGSYALLTSAPPAANALRLEWALSRITGYVGATGALGPMHGERFAAATEQMAPVLDSLTGRGLLYIDPRPDAPAPAFGADKLPPTRHIDLVVDDTPGQVQIDAQLAALEQLAHDRGSAMGLLGRPAPVTTARVAAWAMTLAQRGYVLTPVSAMVAR